MTVTKITNSELIFPHMLILCNLEGNINTKSFKKVFKNLKNQYKTLNNKKIFFSFREDNIKKTLLKEQQNKLNLIIQEERRAVFLKKSLFFSVCLVCLGELDYILVITMNNNIINKWLLETLLNSLVEEIPNNKIGFSLKSFKEQYTDFLVYQKDYADDKTLNDQLNYWQQQLEKTPEKSTFLLDYTRSSVSTYNYKINNYKLKLDKKFVEKLKSLEASYNVSLFMILLATLQILIYRYTGQEDIVIGSPIFINNQNKNEQLRLFINILMLRSKFNKKLTFIDILNQVSKTTIEAYNNKDVSYEKIIDLVKKGKVTKDYNPIFQVMLVLYKAEQEELFLKGIKVKSFKSKYINTKLDLIINAETEVNGEINLNIEYNINLFTKDTIINLANNYLELLKAAITNTQELICNLPILNKVEYKKLIFNWNQTQAVYPNNKTLHQLFEEQVARNPDNIATIYGQRQLSYKELNQKANQLAYHLRGLGVTSNVLVAISMERSIDVIIAIFAVLKAGGAYVPLDPIYPKDRLQFMLEDSGSSILLTNLPTPYVSLNFQGKILSYDNVLLEASKESGDNPSFVTNPNNLSYIIYTSGTTGKPKGVALPHRTLVNLIYWQALDRKNIKHTLRVAQFANFSFDVSIQEFSYTFINGYTLCMVPTDIRKSAIDYAKFIIQESIDTIYITTSMLELVTSAILDIQPTKLELTEIFVSGEILKINNVIREFFLKYSKVRLINQYGPSESHVMLSYTLPQDVKQWLEFPPLGKPIANYKTYVLDVDQQPVPIGVVGELYISGIGLSDGYINRSTLTANKFLINPFCKEEPYTNLYRTGDLVKWLPDGNLQYIGRNDFQVKIRGYRIELGEIESVLSSYKDVNQSAVIVRERINEDIEEKSGGDKYLIGYYVADKKLEEEKIFGYLQSRLPEYMIPSFLVYLENLPLTANGKLDRKALPNPEFSNYHSYARPRNKLERTFCTVWAGVLGLTEDKIGIYDNFFQLGGNSILAIKLVNRLNLELSNSISVFDIFKYNTIDKLVHYIEHNIQDNELIVKGIISETKEQVLSFAQERLYFIEKYEEGSNAYNIPMIYSISNNTKIDILEDSIRSVVSRHEILRTLIKEDDEGNNYQLVLDDKEYPITIEKVKITNKLQLNQELEREINYVYNLSKEYPIRVCLYELDDIYYLSIVIHHIAFDGWSVDIFLRELQEYYRYYLGQSQGLDTKINLPELTIQYKDFALWQRNYLNGKRLEKQLNYWRNKLSNYETLNLVTDKPRPQHIEYAGASESFELDEYTSMALRKLAKELKVSLYSLLLAGYYLMLRIYSNQDDIVIGTPIANRHYSQIENLIGFFVNTLALRIKINSKESIQEFIQKVGHEVVEAQFHQDLPFEQIVEKLNVVKDTSKHPIFQVMFGVHSFGGGLFDQISKQSEVGFEVDGLLQVYKEAMTLYDVAKFDFTTVINDSENKLTGFFNYAISLYTKETVKGFIETYKQILIQLSELDYNTDKQKQCKIADLRYLSNENYNKLITAWNNIDADYTSNKTICDLFEEQVENTPDNIAIVYEDTKLTYKELDEKANQLAHYLRQIHDIKSNTLIALCLDRSENMIITILAILKAGGAYVPIDPAYPDERIAYILEDSNVTLVLTTSDYIQRLEYVNNSNIDRKILVINSQYLQKSLLLQTNTKPQTDTTGNCLAYLMYTSGTTGNPKGVMIEHNGVACFCYKNNYCLVNNETITLGYSNYVFDGSVFDIFATLLNGGKLVIINKDTILDETQLGCTLIKHSVNTMFLTTALFSHYSKLEQNNPLYFLRNLLFGGEKLNPEDLNRFLTYNDHTNLIHVYGPTENIVFSTYCNLNLYNKEIAPIGKKLVDKILYVLNNDLNPVPIGAIGELYIGGTGIAQGYLNKPELTKEKFIINPFQTLEEKNVGKNARLYKTGDLVRWLPDGNLEYLGRNDLQIKIRGHRVELGEIANALLKYSNSKEVTVLTKGEGEDKKLVAYLTYKQILNDNGITEEINRLRTLLKQELPEYMVPSYFAFIEQMPINTSGKLDRKVLLNYKIHSAENNVFVPPINEYEKILSAIWTKVLGKEKVSIHDNFFDLGGHSFLLAKMYAALPEHIKKNLKMVDLFKYSTISMLSNFLNQLNNTSDIDSNCIKKKNTPRRNVNNNCEIAIIGMAGRFPGADSIEEFWKNLKTGKESITHYSKEELLEVGIDKSLLDDPYYIRAQSILSDIKGFDAEFFGYSPSEASIMDPQQRLFLQCAWHALEDSGYNNPKEYQGDIGIYAGVGRNRYAIDNLSSLEIQDPVGEFQFMIGNSIDFLSTRVAYKLNLTGPAITMQTACSTSLVAVHQACTALQVGDCNIALAGGVSLQSVGKEGYLYQPDMIGSPDGKCRAFDAKAQGTIGGQGVGVVVLKPLEQAIADGDHIYAVIKGSAINNDGYNKIGFTAPSPERQTDVIRTAQEKAGITADTITYVEAHGTGTTLGDPIEIEGLTQAFRYTTDQKQFCAIGSVKTNIGHLDTASGITGLIKAVLCLYHKTLVPTLHYNNPNPKINFELTPFYVNTALKEWQTNNLPRRAGVSSFGVGGTNAHVILEEPPVNNLDSKQSKPCQLISLSAHTITALEQKAVNLVNYLQKQPDINLEKLAYTLHIGYQKFKYNRFVIASTVEEVMSALEQPNQSCIEQTGINPLVFMFPGQGSQYIDMGKQLYETEPNFKVNIDKCLTIISNNLSSNITVEDILGTNEKINQTSITQPALFIIEYALAQYLMHLGIRPDAMIGHSIGEYVAACIAGVFSLEDGLTLIIERGKLVQSLSEGKMLAVSLSQQEIAKYLEEADLDIAVINDPESCVISGSVGAINKLNEKLQHEGIGCKLLKVSHAFHSRMLEPILTQFYTIVNKIKLSKPIIPFISNLTGNWIDNTKVIRPQYWVDHLRHTVNFTQGLECLFKTQNLENSMFLEVGPSQVLTSLARRHKSRKSNVILPCMKRFNENTSDNVPLLNVLGNLWAIGIEIDWNQFYEHNKCRIPLPHYPFNNQPYWISSSTSTHITQQVKQNDKINKESLLINNTSVIKQIATPNEEHLQDIILSIWKDFLGFDKISIYEDFFVLGGDSLLAIRIVTKIRKIFNIELRLQDILGNPTIAQLTTLISQKLGSLKSITLEKDWSSIIVKLKDGKKEQPLFLIHPIGGYVLCYRDLVNCMIGDHPVYGIQCPYFEDIGDIASLNTIESIASYYINAIRSIQPEGPYWLLGASLGGLIAFEIAQQLSNSGQEVELLAIVDTVRPDYESIKTDDSTKFLLNIIELFSKKPVSLSQFKQLDELDQLKLLIESMNLNDLDFERQKQVFNQIKLYCKAIISYCSKPYNGKIVFFNAKEQFTGYDGLVLDSTWEGFSQAMTVYEIPGNHLSMLMKPNVNILVTLLESYINSEIKYIDE